jgi:hypothetical protein
MCFHSSTSHVELPSDLVVIAPLKQQFDNLLFTVAQTHGSFAH